MKRIHAPDGTPLSVFVDGEVVFAFENGTEYIKSFENAGREMELDFEDTDPIERQSLESITFRLTDAKVAKNRDVVENNG